ncbi:putative pseudouridine synthase TruD/Pus7 [Eremomyces bilateralis CBS 781.70]|uniref:Pseudouridine synthase TruD/Pus7 n=1 Tax=Eremomyces bilateralis CBS 781.70 TaxID=1392243 RepID=A0A6G1G0J3_9PEZI|nr:putative pseudouridine synthase TruD/Pus7 [Eremomyces bilateralis CBS 781.70]KAF1811502.1 putative pseudouridine synthase TruD/Pus7 [Eremomyces bilateralis CBS 781.70]
MESSEERPSKRARLDTQDGNGNAPAPKFDANAQVTDEMRSGITAYVSPDRRGFSGILKQRYTDFLVNEIQLSGEVLHLDSVDYSRPKSNVPPPATDAPIPHAKNGENSGQEVAKEEETPEDPIQQAPKEQPVDDAGASGADGQKVTAEDVATLENIFGKSCVDSMLELYQNVLQNPTKKARDFKSFTSPSIEDKEKRTCAHQAVRRILHSKLNTVTTDSNTIKISAGPSNRGNDARSTQGNGQAGRKRSGKLDWEELGGQFLHFTLYKENKDTMESLYFLASQMKMQVKSFGFAGTKDRRAVSVQRVSVYRVQAERLAGIGKRLRNAKVGGFEYHPHQLNLGDLQGNEFVITLRDSHFPGEDDLTPEKRLEYANEVVSEAVAAFKGKGFLNYYGLQRFGSFAVRTDEVGLKLLQEDLKGAIDLILTYNHDILPKESETEQPADESNTGATKAPLVSSDDVARARAIYVWETTQSADEAIRIMPRKFAAESNIIRHLGFKDRRSGKQDRLADYQGALGSISRGLRLMYVHAYQSLVWNHVATRRWERFQDGVVEGDLVLVEKAAQMEKGTLDDAGEVVVQPDMTDRAADEEDQHTRARPLSKEEAESGKFSVFDVVLPLPGFDILYPANEIGDYYKEFMGSEKGGGIDPYDMRRKWKDISLSGSYRKLLSRPGVAEHSVKRYSHPDEQLVETDWERLQKKGAAGSQAEEAKEGSGSGDNIAVILKLQLGSSQYATMALRELMKAYGVQTFKPEYGGR